MLIDLFFVLFVIIGIRIGMKKGLILGLFSWVVFLLGIAAAIKISVIVANHLRHTANTGSKWLPLLCFLVLLLFVIFIVEIGCDFLHKHLHFVILSWVDKFLGVIFYIAVYGLIFSILLFYAEKVGLIKRANINASLCYKYIEPIGPKVMDTIGRIFPIFKDMFLDLRLFYDRLSKGPIV
jgi:membrane protein required for colicin V production